MRDTAAVNQFSGSVARITHVDADTWKVDTMDGVQGYQGYKQLSFNGDGRLELDVDVADISALFYGAVYAYYNKNAGDPASLQVSVDGGAPLTVGGSLKHTYSFSLPLAQGTHHVVFQANDCLVVLHNLGLVSPDKHNVTRALPQSSAVPGLGSYKLLLSGVEQTALSAGGSIDVPYGTAVRLIAQSADQAQWVFNTWTLSDSAHNAATASTAAVGEVSFLAEGSTTVTPSYTAGVNPAAYLLADPTEKAPGGGDYQFTMSNAAAFSGVETGGRHLEISEPAFTNDETLTWDVTVPAGEAYISHFTMENAGTATYSRKNADGTYTDVGTYTQSQLYNAHTVYAVLDEGTYRLTIRDMGNSTPLKLSAFSCEAFGAMTRWKITTSFTAADPNTGATSDAAEAVLTSGALTIPDYAVGQGGGKNHVVYVAPAYAGRFVDDTSDGTDGSALQRYALDTAVVKNLGLFFSQSATAAGVGGTNALRDYLNADSTYTVNFKFYRLAGTPFMDGTTLYANGTPLYLSGSGDVFYYDTDGSHSRPVYDLMAGSQSRQMQVAPGAVIYGGSNKNDVARSELHFDSSYGSGTDFNYTIYGGGNGYGVTGDVIVACTSNTNSYALITRNSNGSTLKPRSISVTIDGRAAVTGGLTGGDAAGSVTVSVGAFTGNITGGTSQSGTVSLSNTGGQLITGSLTGITGDAAKGSLVIDVTGGIDGSVVGVVPGGKADSVRLTLNTVAGSVTGLADGAQAGGLLVKAGGVNGDFTGLGTGAAVTGSVTLTATVGGSAVGLKTNASAGSVIMTVGGGSSAAGLLSGASAASLTMTVYSPAGSVTGTGGHVAGDVSLTVSGGAGGTGIAVTGASGAVVDGTVSVTVKNVTAIGSARAVEGGTAAGAALTLENPAYLYTADTAVVSTGTVTGNASLTLTGTAAGSGSAVTRYAVGSKAVIGGHVTVDARLATDGLTLLDAQSGAQIAGKTVMNLYADAQNGAVQARGGTAGGEVRLYAVYSQPVYVPAGAAAPTVAAALASTVQLFKQDTSGLAGLDEYLAKDGTRPYARTAEKEIFANGFAMQVTTGGGVTYTDTDGTKVTLLPANQLSGYTVYGGSEFYDCAATEVSVAVTDAATALTVFAGGKGHTVTGTAKLTLINTAALTTVYGGSNGAEMGTASHLDVLMQAYQGGSGTFIAGCRDAAFNGSAYLDLNKNYTLPIPACETSWEGSIYVAGDNGAFTGKTTIAIGSSHTWFTAKGGVTDSYTNGAGIKCANTGTFDVQVYADTPTRIHCPAGSTASAADPSVKSVSIGADGYVTIVPTVKCANIGANSESLYEIYANGSTLLHAGSTLYLDKGTVGVLDSADVPLRGYYSGKLYLSNFDLTPADSVGFTDLDSTVDSRHRFLEINMGAGVVHHLDLRVGLDYSRWLGWDFTQTIKPDTFSLTVGESGSTDTTVMKLQCSRALPITALTVNAPFTGLKTDNNTFTAVNRLDMTQNTLLLVTSSGGNYYEWKTGPVDNGSTPNASFVTESGYTYVVGGNALLVYDGAYGEALVEDLNDNGVWDTATEGDRSSSGYKQIVYKNFSEILVTSGGKLTLLTDLPSVYPKQLILKVQGGTAVLASGSVKTSVTLWADSRYDTVFTQREGTAITGATIRTEVTDSTMTTPHPITIGLNGTLSSAKLENYNAGSTVTLGSTCTVSNAAT